MEEIEERLGQLFLEVDDLFSDVTNQVQASYMEVLDYKSHSFLACDAYIAAKQRLNKLEVLYTKLKMTKEEYQEYYKSHILDSK